MSDPSTVSYPAPETTTPIAWTYLRGAKDNRGQPCATTWPELLSWARTALAYEVPNTPEGKESLPAICPVLLAETCSCGKCDGGRHRLKQNVLSVTLGVLDCDDLSEAKWGVVSSLSDGVRGFAYTSPSDGIKEGGRRARLVFALSRPLAASECEQFRGGLAAYLGVPADEKCFQAAALFFVGKFAGTPPREFHEFAGPPLDVETVLAWAPAVAPKVTWDTGLFADHPPGDPAIVQPLIAALAAELGAIWTSGDRQDWSLQFFGWAKRQGWAESELAELFEALPNDPKRAKYDNQVRRSDPSRVKGPPRVALEKLLGPVAFARVDKLVNSHPNTPAIKAARLQAKVSPYESAFPKAGVKGDAEAANDGEAHDGAERRADLGNARRLVRLHGRDLRYFTARGVWYAWDGVRWAKDEIGEVVRRAKDAAESVWEEAKAETDDDKRKAAFKWAGQCQDRSRITNMIALAETEQGIPVRACDLDADPWLLNTQSGVLDLRSGELTPPDRNALMTKVTAARFEPGARSDLWGRFVDRMTGGDRELADYIQRAMGYALFGAWREKMFWFGYGPPDGAKSTFLGAIAGVLGDYHVTASAGTWMVQSNTGGNREDVTALLGARLVTTLEVRPSARFDPEMMKRVTGGDEISAAGKYEHQISFSPAFALWFGANDRPIIPDDDQGFWSRVRCVPFTQVIPKADQDKALKEKLTGPDHNAAVLAWLVEGCLAWQREGIGTCAAVERATAAYRRSMNQAADFFDEVCELTGNPLDVITTTELRLRYDGWCSQNKTAKPLKATAWGERLRALGVCGGDDASRVNGKRVWSGIRLRERE